jgi:hypothetical protein
MTDIEMARLLRTAPRPGFAQACGVAFLAVAPAVLFFADIAVGAATEVTNRDPESCSKVGR